MQRYAPANTSALDAANYILCLADAEHIELDPITLQKILYYCQCWALREGQRLFDDRVEAWKHGPVVRSVYTAHSGSSKIRKSDSERFYELDANQKDLIQGVWESLKQYHGFTLSDWTHEAGSAWQKARAGLPDTASSNRELLLDDMATDAAKLEQSAAKGLSDAWDDLVRFQK